MFEEKTGKFSHSPEVFWKGRGKTFFSKKVLHLTVEVNLKKSVDHSYPIIIKSGIFDEIGQVMADYAVSGWAIVSDNKVARLYGDKLLRALRRGGKKVELFSFPAGERSKSRNTKATIEDAMLSAGFGRDSAVIALGGGVTGDLAGFVSATYMRGIPYIQVPTTLLAMVDSSIGGKTGIDVGAGKNLIGAFHQPVAVFIDPQLLSTLPKKHIRNGMAELVKHAVIADKHFFSFLEENLERIVELDGSLLEKALKRSCEIKAEVVEKDEREGGLRQILNYGHTVGHAIEKLSGYRILHGEAVAVGMMVEGLISCEMGYMEIAELQRQNKLLRQLGFSARILGRFEVDHIISVMGTDKKVRAGKIRMVLPKRIGEMASCHGEWSHPVRKNLLVRAITRISEAII